VEEERYMINGVLTLASRSLRSIMTPRGEISWVDANLSVDEIRQQLLSSPHSLFPVCRGELDEIIGIVRAKEMLVALERASTWKPLPPPRRRLWCRKRWIRSICWGAAPRPR
jgi:CBS domain containing-hemolysin-like protein